jgi:hypothetical protein
VTLDHRPPQAVGILVQRPERSALGADEAVGEDVLVVARTERIALPSNVTWRPHVASQNGQVM